MQTELFARYTAESGQAQAETFSARAGYSEHQTGLALDINTASRSAHFEETPAYVWLTAHCAEYGFALRYPDGRQSVTGYSFEPWHYRYVGADIAAACMGGGLTLEEYLAQQPTAQLEPLPTETASYYVPKTDVPKQTQSAEGETSYTIKVGDTLGTIAKAVYGDVMRYREIFARNADRLKSPDVIYPGQVITLPAK